MKKFLIGLTIVTAFSLPYFAKGRVPMIGRANKQEVNLAIEEVKKDIDLAKRAKNLPSKDLRSIARIVEEIESYVKDINFPGQNKVTLRTLQAFQELLIKAGQGQKVFGGVSRCLMTAKNWIAGNVTLHQEQILQKRRLQLGQLDDEEDDVPFVLGAPSSEGGTQEHYEVTKVNLTPEQKAAQKAAIAKMKAKPVGAQGGSFLSQIQVRKKLKTTKKEQKPLVTEVTEEKSEEGKTQLEQHLSGLIPTHIHHSDSDSDSEDDEDKWAAEESDEE
jgi:hypothetical protein